MVVALSLVVMSLSAQEVSDSIVPTRANRHQRTAVTVKGEQPRPVRAVNLAGDTLLFSSADSIMGIEGLQLLPDTIESPEAPKVALFNPDPMRALWLSALCPGLGQIYNRRYWKLPIIVGAFVGLGYGTSWNNRMLQDYSQAYRDLLDDDPNSRSYMNFFPPTTEESSLDKSWLQSTLKNKRDYYRRYRDLCIIGMVGIYLLNVIDAYVDASLAHFDISPDLSMQVKPTVINTHVDRVPAVGLQCAVHF